MNNALHFSSKKHNWETPQSFFEELDREFNFTLDATADDLNHKCEQYFTEEQDALSQEWKGSVFCNPPYGRELPKFIKKAYEESQKDHNDVIVLLIPARTDTKAWHDYILGQAEIRFIKGRLMFEVDGNKIDRAPFPSALVIFKKAGAAHEQ